MRTCRMIEEDNIKHIINLDNSEQTMRGDTNHHSVSLNLSLRFPKLSSFASALCSVFRINDQGRTAKREGRLVVLLSIFKRRSLSEIGITRGGF